MLTLGSPLILLDVREPNEHAYCHLPGSVLIPLGDLPARLEELQIPEGGLIVAYCHHGIRSLRAAGYLQHVGIQNVASMSGGIEAWSLTVDPSVPRY